MHDIINIATRRNPYVQLILYPAKVQGDGAAQTIVQGIRRLSEESVDVIIVGRGGGSMEDLWAFNEEIVAEAIYQCPIPVISAVGHETDFTIADFVADLRAPTPSAAAELAVFDVRRTLDALYAYKDRMARAILMKTEDYQEQLFYRERQLKSLNPANQLREKRQRLIDCEEKLALYAERALSDKRQRLALLAGRLDGVSPLKRLSSGYAYVSDKDNRLVDSAGKVQKGDKLFLTLSDGIVESTVDLVEKKDWFSNRAQK